MSEIQKTNVCCLDLTKECIDYLKSLDLNVYEGTLGSVFSIIWGAKTYGVKPVLVDYDYPINLQEYHVLIHDMENPNKREYKREEHYEKVIESNEQRHLECQYPVTSFDLRPFGLYRLSSKFRDTPYTRRIEIIFVGTENEVSYLSNVADCSDCRQVGTFSNIDGWNLVTGTEKYGNRVKLEDNSLSKSLFVGCLNQVNYCRVFSLPTEIQDDKKVIKKDYCSLLANETGECISYMAYYSDDYIKFVLPQVNDKAGLLKELFENVLFQYFSDYFPDVEARSWINSGAYLLPDELEIEDRKEAKCQEFDLEIKKLEEEEKIIHEKNKYLKCLLTETGGSLVTAVKTFLEWLGFENVIDKDETLKEDELKEEDLCLEYEGIHVFIEVKGINGTSTDAECSQVDKIVNRRIRQLNTTKVHGIYIVNNQKNVEPLKRTIPPFNDRQIKDAEDQSRTMVYTMQLFALFFDIENGYISKDFARKRFLISGLANYHSNLTTLGTPYKYFKSDTVICLELNGIKLAVGDMLYYKDDLHRLVGRKVESIEQEKQSVTTVPIGKVGIKLDNKIPRNREVLCKSNSYGPTSLAAENVT